MFTRRDGNPKLASRYSDGNPAQAFLLRGRAQATLSALREHGLLPLGDKRILDVGCGHGQALQFLSELGASPRNVYGVDILPARLAKARERVPNARCQCADARALPFPDGSFDLVLQSMVLSAITDRTNRTEAAAEMLRVLGRQGHIISYDFWINPTNRNVVPIGRSELQRLFPSCVITTRRTTLAPPLARLVVPVSRRLGLALEAIPLLRTHYLAVIQKGRTCK